MKKIFFVIPVVLLIVSCGSGTQSNWKASNYDLSTKKDSISYVMGLDMVTGLKDFFLNFNDFTVNIGAYTKGFEEELEGKSQLSEEVTSSLMTAFQTMAQSLQLDPLGQTKPDSTGGATYVNEFALKTQFDSISYVLGTELAKNLRTNYMNPEDPILLAAPFKAGLLDRFNDAGMIDDAQSKSIMNNFRAEMQQKQMERKRVEGEKNKTEGAQFLAENAKKQNVKTTDSGLQYEVLREGKGASPKTSDKVKVHYEGKLLDGTIFDSSYQKDRPIEFQLTGVIRGWTEGLQLMQPGAKYTFYIPYDLAYGQNGYPPTIPPFSTLIFDVELLEIIK